MKLNVHSIITGPFQENSYILSEKLSKDCILVDPGDEAEKISYFIDDNNFNPIAIINTHAHLDHIGAVTEIKNKYNIPFYLHSAEKQILESYPLSCRMFGMEVKPVPVVDNWIHKAGKLTIGGFNFSIIETPGHTPGGVSFLFNNHLFVGDTLFQGSVGRTDLPGGDYSILQDSLRRLIALLPKETIVHSGHGPDTTLNEEFHNNPYLKFLN